jgi:2,3-bisphosphoglycerate-dependent phosphoglycerate mutase
MSTMHLTLLRHGATAPNLQGLRCGGDLDAPLTELGRHQASEAALRILELRLEVGVILTSRMQRTRETAQIVSRLLHGVPIVIEPAFAERRLGQWNLRPIAENEAELMHGVTPPGGESNLEFVARVSAAVEALLPRLAERPLLVGSKGIGRVLRELAESGPQRRQSLGNGQLAHFDLTAFAARHATLCAP